MIGADLARALDPVILLQDIGIEPEPWQANCLRSKSKRQLLRCCRQAGKSTIAAAKAVHKAIYKPGSLTLIFAPSLTQSKEVFRKATQIYQGLDYVPDLGSDSVLRLETQQTHSRIVALPSSGITVRGWSAPDLIVLDEGAHLSEELIHAVLPMIASNADAEIFIPSTPNGKQGLFHDLWENNDDWEKTFITHHDSANVSDENVEFYRRTVGDLMYRQEFLCEFIDPDTAVFPVEVIQNAADPELVPLWC